MYLRTNLKCLMTRTEDTKTTNQKSYSRKTRQRKKQCFDVQGIVLGMEDKNDNGPYTQIRKTSVSGKLYTTLSLHNEKEPGLIKPKI